MRQSTIPMRARRRWAACVGALALGVAGIGGAAADPLAIIGEWVDGSADNPVVGVTVDDVAHDAASGVTTITDLTVSLSLIEFARGFMSSVGQDPDEIEGTFDYIFRFPTLQFTNLTQEEGYFAAEAMTAQTMELETRITVDEDIQSISATYSGLSATTMRWAEMPELEEDPTRPISRYLPLLQASVDFSADDVIIESAVTRSVVPEDDVTIVQRVGETRMRDIVNGDIAEITIASLDMQIESEDDESMDVTIGPITAEDYNYGASIDILFGDRQADDYAPIVGAMRINDIAVAVPEEEFAMAIEAVTMADIGVRNPSAPILPIVDGFLLSGLADPDFEPEPEELARLIGAVYGAMRLGAFEITGITVEASDLTRGTVEAYGMRDLSAQGLAALYVRGIDFATTEDIEIRYDLFEIADVGFPDLEALIMLEDAIDDGDIETILAAMPIIGRIENSGIRIVSPEEGTDIALDSSVVEMRDHIGPVPTSIRLNGQGLRMAVDQLDEEAREPLKAMGYDEIAASWSALARWNEDTNDLGIEAGLALEDGGTLALDATIGGVPRLIFERPDQTGVMSLLGATFKQLDIRFEDDSIIARALEFAGAQEGMDGEAMKARMLAMVPVVLSQFGDAQLATNATEAVTQLVETGAPLAIAVSAPVPLPIVAIATSMQSNPASIIEVLEIEVSN